VAEWVLQGFCIGAVKARGRRYFHRGGSGPNPGVISTPGRRRGWSRLSLFRTTRRLMSRHALDLSPRQHIADGLRIPLPAPGGDFPRAFSASAILCSDVAPERRNSRITGSTLTE
jgi:hypothetical protein